MSSPDLKSTMKPCKLLVVAIATGIGSRNSVTISILISIVFMSKY